MSISPENLALGQRPSSLSKTQFVETFGAVYEHSPWVAARTHDAGLGTQLDSLPGLAQAMADTLASANKDEKLALICAHPDLAGKAAAAGDLTDESNDEQASAGLDQCTTEELARFHQLNNAYKAKFNFPFIMAVKGSNRHLILAAFEQRIENSVDVEFDTALGEINKIAKLRLQALFNK